MVNINLKQNVILLLHLITFFLIALQNTEILNMKKKKTNDYKSILLLFYSIFTWVVHCKLNK